MARYIDVDKLKKALKDLPEQERIEYMGIYDVINSQSNADVQEVKHGKWVIHNDRQDWQYTKSYMIFIECSECGKSHFLGTNDCANSFNSEELRRLGNIADYNYCGKCGAKMDKE